MVLYCTNYYTYDVALDDIFSNYGYIILSDGRPDKKIRRKLLTTDDLEQAMVMVGMVPV